MEDIKETKHSNPIRTDTHLNSWRLAAGTGHSQVSASWRTSTEGEVNTNPSL